MSRPASEYPDVVTVCLGGLDQGLDLAALQVLSCPKFGVRKPHRSNCSIYITSVA
jgi:hypothetical protein